MRRAGLIGLAAVLIFNVLFSGILAGGRAAAASLQENELVSELMSLLADHEVEPWTETEVVSLTADGLEGNRFAANLDITPDGRYVVFESNGDNMDPRIVPAQFTDKHIYVHDRLTGKTELIDANELGEIANYYSENPSISDDGNLIVFESRATNLLGGYSFSNMDPEDYDNNNRIYAFNREERALRLVSVYEDVSGNEQPGNYDSWDAEVSGDGSSVVFVSRPYFFDEEGSSSTNQIFVRNLDDGITTMISNPEDGLAEAPAINGDGSIVTYISSQYIEGNDYTYNIYVYDAGLDEISKVTDDPTLTDLVTHSGLDISADGKKIVFSSTSDGLVADDNNGVEDIFLIDRWQAPPSISRISIGEGEVESNGLSAFPSISADGQSIGFISEASNLLPDINLTGMFNINIAYHLDTVTGRLTNLGGLNQPIRASEVALSNNDFVFIENGAGRTYVKAALTAVSWPSWQSGKELSFTLDEGLQLAWSQLQEHNDIVGYRIYEKAPHPLLGAAYTQERLLGFTDAETTSFVIAAAPTDLNTVSYRVEAVDSSYRISRNGPVLSFETDDESPSWPASAVIEASNLLSTQLTLSWPEAADNRAVSRYEVYQNGQLLQEINTSFLKITNLQPETAYTFFVIAKDAAGNSSVPLPSLTVTTLSTAAAILSHEVRTNGDIVLTWSEGEGEGVVYYELLQNDQSIAQLDHDQLSYIVLEPEPNATLLYKVIGYDENYTVVYETQQLTITTEPLYITRVSMSNHYINNRSAPIDATETITVIGQPDREAIVLATYTTWQDEAGEYTLTVPRAVTVEIPMTESLEAPGTYTGSFTFSEGIAELRRIEAKLAYRSQFTTSSLTVGALPITAAARLKLTAQSSASLKGYKLSLFAKADGSTQSVIIHEEKLTADVVFNRVKPNQALLLRVFSPAGNLLAEHSIAPLQAGRVSEQTQQITPIKVLELTLIGSETPQQQVTVYMDGKNSNDDYLEHRFANTDASGRVFSEWSHDVEEVVVWVFNPPKQFMTVNQVVSLSGTTTTKEVIELELRPKSTVRGTIYDPSGKPLSGVNVTLLNYEHGFANVIEQQTVTDEQGKYELETLSGFAELAFSYGRNMPGQYDAQLYPNETLVVDHQFSPLTKHEVKINLYLTYNDGIRQGPVELNLSLAHLFNIRLDGQFLQTDQVTLYRENGSKVTLSVNGMAHNLSKFDRQITLEEDGYTKINVDLTPEVLTLSAKLDAAPQWSGYSLAWRIILSKLNEQGEWSVDQTTVGAGLEHYFNLNGPGTYKLFMESEAGVVERIFQHNGRAHLDLGVLTPETSPTVLKDRSSNHISASPVMLTAGQWTKARLSYRVDREVKDSSIVLQLPKGIELVEGSVTWNGAQTQYTQAGNAISIATGDLQKGEEGIITYQLTMTSNSDKAPLIEAYMRLGSGEAAAKERIGTVMLTKATLTVHAPANPTGLNWQLNGMGEAGSKVAVYVSDTLLGRTVVSPGGYWSMEVNVPDPKGAKRFTLYAESQLAEHTYRTPIKYVHYDPLQPKVASLTIEQTGIRRTTYDLTNGMVSFPSVINTYYPLRFEIGFDHPEKVENVELHIAGQYETISGKGQLRDGIYYVELVQEYTKPLGQYIYITFDRKQGGRAAPDTTEDVVATLPPNMRDYIIKEQEPFKQIDEDTIKGSVDLRFPESEDLDMGVTMQLERNTGYVPTAEELLLAEETGIEVYGLSYNLVNTDDELIIQVVSYIPEASISNFENAFSSDSSAMVLQQFAQARQFQALNVKAGNPLVKMALDIAFNKKNKIGKAGTEVVSFLSSHNSLNGAGGIQDRALELGNLAEQIGKCNPAMAGYYAPKINNLIEQSMGIEVAKVGVSLLGIALAPATFGGSLAMTVGTELVGMAMDAYVGHQTKILRDGINKYSGKCEPKPKANPDSGGGSVTTINLGDPIAAPVWIYDPSGFVYETFEDNRLEGVTATVTHKDSITGTFVVWDADWFGQINPQVTDMQGRYGWDVPPGLWQVIYEKAGYVTAKSDELQVTPPHFDVNIPMISYAVPKLQVVKAKSSDAGTAIIIQSDKYVHVSNLTADQVSVLYNGAELEGELEAISPRPYGDEASMLARDLRFISAEKITPGEELIVTVRGGSIVSYSGAELDSDYTEAIKVTAKDTQAPTVVSAVTAPTGDLIELSFSEPLDKRKVLNPADFILAGTMRSVRAADYGNDGQSIKLYLNGKLLSSNELQVTIVDSYLSDLSGNAYAGDTIAVRIVMASSNAALRALRITGYTLSPSFKPDLTSYQMYVPKGIQRLEVTATAADDGATLTINGRAAASGVALDTAVENEEIIITITATDGLTKEYYLITIVRGTAPVNPGDSGPGGGAVQETNTPPSDSTAVLDLKSGEAGSLSLGDQITVSIPSGAFGQNMKLMIEAVKQMPSAINAQGKQLVSSIFEITKSASGSFHKPVTITLKLNSALKSGQIAGIYYYDEAKKEWIGIGGKVNGTYITAKVDHFTQFAAFVTEPAAGFKDVSGHWALDSIARAIDLAVVKGYADATIRPNTNINRAEFVVMLSRALGLEEAQAVQSSGDVSATEDFSDAIDIPSWAREHIAWAVHAGLVNGYSDRSFGPNELITRAEMVTIISRALGEAQLEETEADSSFVDADHIPAWARLPVARTAAAGIIKGKPGNRFAPQDQATRAEAVTMIIQLLNSFSAREDEE